MLIENSNGEKRKFPRLQEAIPITLRLDGGSEENAICRNISEGGAFVEIPNGKFDEEVSPLCYKWAKMQIKISLINGVDNVEAIAKTRWFKQLPQDNKYGFGIEFVEIDVFDKNRISSYIKQKLLRKEPLPEIKNFTLLINGQEVDTGQYRYFPFAEKIILQPEITKFMLDGIKRGETPADYKNYIFARFCLGNCDFNQQAITSAYQASKIYRKLNLDSRVKIVNDIHNLLKEKEEEFIKLLSIEGHPYRLAKWEIEGMLKGTDEKTLAFYKDNIEKTIGRDDNEFLSCIRRPDGVVCLATPKNAPSSISVIGVFALLGGNAMIIKPPLSVPLSTIYFWKEIVYKALRRNNAPLGTVNIITGNSHNIMQEWIKSPYVNSIIYIGDSRKGTEIGKQIYAGGKKPILELSGNDIMIIWKDAPIEEATDSLLDSFLGSTQICMVPKLALIHEEIHEKFKNRFIEKVKMIKPGLPSNSDTRLAPVGKIKEFSNTLKDALQKGAILLCGGNRIDWKGEYDLKGQFVQPTVLDIKIENPYIKNMLCIKEEIFFPLLPIIMVNGHTDEDIWDKIVKFANKHEYGLRVSAWTQSPNCIERFVKEISNCGILRINSSHIDFSLYLSNNGGVSKSGGPFGEMNYIWQKTTHLQGISIFNSKRK